MSLEKDIERRTYRKARELGWNDKKVGTDGWPDRLFIKKGVYVWIEFKQPRGRLSKRQEKIIENLKKDECFVFVCDNVKDAIAALEETFTMEVINGS